MKMNIRVLSDRLVSVIALFFSLTASVFATSLSQPVITGTIYDEQGRPARNADVCLYRTNFQTIDASEKYLFPRGATCCRRTGRAGNYEIMLPDSGHYILLARQKNFWVMGIIPASTNADTIRRGDTLRPVGSLRFRVNVEGGKDHRAIAALTGTPFSFMSDSSGNITAGGIPAGTYSAIIKSLHKGYRALVCSLRIRSGRSDIFPDILSIPIESGAYVPSNNIFLEAAVIPDSLSKPYRKVLSPEPPPTNKAKADSILEAATLFPSSKDYPGRKKRTPPVVKAPPDTFIGIFDSLLLTGTAEDDGGIVSMGWDIGAKGEFITTGDGDIILPPFRAPVRRFLCIFRAIDDEGLISYDTTAVYAGLLWKSIKPPDELLGRNGHSFITFKDALFIIGGKRSDVWTSNDGSSWTLLTDTAPFGKIFGHSTVVFKDRIWVIGGKTAPRTFNSAIWSSATGVNWEREATIPFSKRHYQAAVVFQSKIWVVGGLSDSENDPILNDVWSSADGVHWNRVAVHAPFGERYGHGCTVFNDRIVLLGGFNDAVGKQKSFGDVWQSSNGTDWTCIADSALFSKELYHSVITFDGRVWAIGGYERTGTAERFTDVLFTSDGASWINLTPDQGATERVFCASTVFKNSIMVIPSDSYKIWIVK